MEASLLLVGSHWNQRIRQSRIVNKLFQDGLNRSGRDTDLREACLKVGTICKSPPGPAIPNGGISGDDRVL
jgi:hypothetical protein